MVAAAADTVTAGSATENVANLLAENARLRQKIEQLESAAALPTGLRGSSSSSTPVTSPMPSVKVVGHKIDIKTADEVIIALVLLLMAILWVLPRLWPFRRCCSTRLHRVYPMILLINLGILFCALNYALTISVNDAFFVVKRLVEIVIDKTESLLIAGASLLVLLVAWKFKDRILETLGIENPFLYFGEFRDWFTCWSMKRFYPLEVLIWKVEDLPSAAMLSHNDLYCEVSHGYNVTMRTRVHQKAGHSCTFKESFQLNYDPYDVESRMTIAVKNQGVVGGDLLASVQLGATQVQRLEEPQDGRASKTANSLNSVWRDTADSFKRIDLIPSGTIYLRFRPAAKPQGDGSWFSW
jgi:hypothetical protein